jgi:hypothetical protein
MTLPFSRSQGAQLVPPFWRSTSHDPIAGPTVHPAHPSEQPADITIDFAVSNADASDDTWSRNTLHPHPSVSASWQAVGSVMTHLFAARSDARYCSTRLWQPLAVELAMEVVEVALFEVLPEAPPLPCPTVQS